MMNQRDKLISKRQILKDNTIIGCVEHYHEEVLYADNHYYA